MGEWLTKYLPALLGFLGSLPFFYQVWRDRRTRNWLEGNWRGALDGWSAAMLLLDRYMILESDIDERIKTEYDKLTIEHKTAWDEYKGREKK